MTLTLRRLQLSTFPETYAIVGLSQGAQLPAWATQGSFFSVTRTSDELSIIVEESRVPAGLQFQGGWRVIKVHGHLCCRRLACSLLSSDLLPPQESVC